MNIEKLKRMALSLAKRASKETGENFKARLSIMHYSEEKFRKLQCKNELEYDSRNGTEWLKYEDAKIEIIIFREGI